MITLRMVSAQMARVKVASEDVRATLEMQLATMVERRQRQRGPSKLSRRLRRKQELGLSGAF